MKKVDVDAKLDEIAEAAASVFIEKGYKRTQMADVARKMGVSQGNLYNYVESKDALFDLVVQRSWIKKASVKKLTKKPTTVPIKTPAPGETLDKLRKRILLEAETPQLNKALRANETSDFKKEIEAIIIEIYDLISRHRQGIKLLIRSSLDWPELSLFFHNELRAGVLVRLTKYFERRFTSGYVFPLPDPAIAALLILETCSWFAMHRKFHPSEEQYDDSQCRRTVIDTLTNGFQGRSS